MVKNYFDLTGRVAVVIGGTSGLGRTIAMGLGEAGATVVPPAAAQELAEEVSSAVRSLGRETLSYPVDVATEPQSINFATRC